MAKAKPKRLVNKDSRASDDVESILKILRKHHADQTYRYYLMSCALASMFELDGIKDPELIAHCITEFGREVAGASAYLREHSTPTTWQ